MQATRSRVKPFAASTAGFIALVAVLLAALIAQPWAPRYRLFVSKPLPDGSRYTFLYPAHLQNMQENGKGASPEVTAGVTVWTMNQSDSTWSQFLSRMGFSVPSPRESIGVVVIPLKTRNVRDGRRTDRWNRFGGLRRNEYLTDARTRTQFILYHSCPASAAAQFAAHDPVIARSFRVLPPGTASPNLSMSHPVVGPVRRKE
jgi:hypothetical protein